MSVDTASHLYSDSNRLIKADQVFNHTLEGGEAGSRGGGGSRGGYPPSSYGVLPF